MTARRILLACCLVVSTVALLPAGAGATRDPGVVTHRQGNPGAATRYWTPQRMRNATPKGLLKVNARDLQDRPAPERGTPFIVEEADPTATTFASSDAETTMTASATGGLIPFERVHIPDPGSTPEYARHGAIFFTAPTGGDFGCSGTVLNSDNGSVVWTAGHCLYDNSKVSQHVVFVPGYENGERPFGVWEAAMISAPQQWVQNENLDYDFGAFNTTPNELGTLVDVVGGRGIAFNQEPTEMLQSFGYPGCCKPEFDGHNLFSCTSQGSARLAPGAIAMGCDMEFGSSGGGWVMREGYITSNVSGGDMQTWPNVALGPYLGEAARTLYDSVRGGTSTIPEPTPTGPVEPDETHAMKITLRLRRHLIARGSLTATDGFSQCAKTAPMVLLRYRKSAATYFPVGKMRFTQPDGTFRFKIRDRAGRYAVLAYESPYDNSDNCAEAYAFARHRH